MQHTTQSNRRTFVRCIGTDYIKTREAAASFFFTESTAWKVNHIVTASELKSTLLIDLEHLEVGGHHSHPGRRAPSSSLKR